MVVTRADTFHGTERHARLSSTLADSSVLLTFCRRFRHSLDTMPIARLETILRQHGKVLLRCDGSSVASAAGR
jgi:hypothetical protein